MFRKRDLIFMLMVVALAFVVLMHMGYCYTLYSDARHDEIPGSCLPVMFNK